MRQDSQFFIVIYQASWRVVTIYTKYYEVDKYKVSNNIYISWLFELTQFRNIKSFEELNLSLHWSKIISSFHSFIRLKVREELLSFQIRRLLVHQYCNSTKTTSNWFLKNQLLKQKFLMTSYGIKLTLVLIILKFRELLRIYFILIHIMKIITISL